MVIRRKSPDLLRTEGRVGERKANPMDEHVKPPMAVPLLEGESYAHWG